MPVRSINFKLIVPRGDRDDGSACAIWSTHREVNLATRYYEEALLAMRQWPFLANFLRALATPEAIERWSLTSRRERLIKIGARLVRHAHR